VGGVRRVTRIGKRAPVVEVQEQSRAEQSIAWHGIA